MSKKHGIPIRVLDPAPMVQALRTAADLLESGKYTWVEGGIAVTQHRPDFVPETVVICSDLKMTLTVPSKSV